jgi:hypothetical protein
MLPTTTRDSKCFVTAADRADVSRGGKHRDGTGNGIEHLAALTKLYTVDGAKYLKTPMASSVHCPQVHDDGPTDIPNRVFFPLWAELYRL